MDFIYDTSVLLLQSVSKKSSCWKKAPGTHCTVSEQHAVPKAFPQLQHINVIGLKKHLYNKYKNRVVPSRHKF